MLFICYPITNVEILKGHKYRLEIPKQTAKTLFRWSGLLRRIYNAALAQRKLAYDLCRKSVSYYDQCEELTEVKEAFPEFKLLPSQAIQEVLGWKQRFNVKKDDWEEVCAGCLARPEKLV